MRLSFRSVLLTFGLAFLGTATASAGSSMQVGGITSQPTGHYDFCKKSPEECQAVHYQEKLRLSPKLWGIVQEVNYAVNKQVRPFSDLVIYDKDEVWAFPKGRGDCEDYALEKRRRLILAGIPPGNLLITVVRRTYKEEGRIVSEGHAVLSLVLAHGDLILDNLVWDIRPWNEYGYTFLKRQSMRHAGHWMKIIPSLDTSPVASVEQ